MSVYVFRINYEDCYDLVKSEILRGKLRQGWGADGLDIRRSLEEYSEAFRKYWDEPQSCIQRKYDRIRIMLDMKPGDLIIIPKLNLNAPLYDWEEWNKYFAVVKVAGEYEFDPIKPETRNYNEFGHVIPVEPVGSFHYERDDLTRTISGKFRGYQDPVNNVNKTEFIETLQALLSKPNEASPKLTSIEAVALSGNVSDAREKYLLSILEQIKKWNFKQLEKIITEIFTKNGYQLLYSNSFDGDGGDIDAAFACYQSTGFLADFVEHAPYGSKVLPQIRVQAKKKDGEDYDDIKGVKQLATYEGHERAINILINTADKFSDEAKKEAEKSGVILISGLELAKLLVKYGLNA